MYAIKLSFNNELRRVPCANPNLAYQELLQTAKRVFPPLQDCSDFYFSWLDDEGDNIVLTSNDELQDALQCMKSENRKTFRFHIYLPDSKSVPAAARSSPTLQVHEHVTCDGCGMYPLVGARFKCAVRDNYDLCNSCEAKTDRSFPMIKIYNPQQEPAAVVVNLRAGPEGHRHGRGRRWREGKKAQQENSTMFPSAMAPAPFIAAADAFVRNMTQDSSERQNTVIQNACSPFFAAVNAFVSALPEQQEQTQGNEEKEMSSEKVTTSEDSDIEQLMVENVLRMSEQHAEKAQKYDETSSASMSLQTQGNGEKEMPSEKVTTSEDSDIEQLMVENVLRMSEQHAEKAQKYDGTSSASMSLSELISMCDVDHTEIANENIAAFTPPENVAKEANCQPKQPSVQPSSQSVSVEENVASSRADAVWAKCWAREIEIFANMGLTDTKVLTPLFFEHLKNPVSIVGGEVSMDGVQAIVNRLFN